MGDGEVSWSMSSSRKMGGDWWMRGKLEGLGWFWNPRFGVPGVLVLGVDVQEQQQLRVKTGRRLVKDSRLNLAESAEGVYHWTRMGAKQATRIFGTEASCSLPRKWESSGLVARTRHQGIIFNRLNHRTPEPRIKTP